MKVSQIAYTLVGSIIVFTACAVSKDAVDGVANHGSDASVDPSDAVAVSDSAHKEDGSFVDAVIDALADALPDPEKDAMAGPTDPPAYSGGSRIKPKMQTVTFTDGAKGNYFGGWYDSLRAEDCAPYLASDGKQRCLPIFSSTTGASVITLYFSDSACSVPIYMHATGSAPTKYIIGYTAAGGYRFTPVMGDISNPTTVYYKSGSTCTTQSWPGTYQAVSVGAELPATTFVEATVTTTYG